MYQWIMDTAKKWSRASVYQRLGNFLFPQQLIATEYDPADHLHAEPTDRSYIDADKGGDHIIERIRVRIAAENARIQLKKHFAIRFLVLAVAFSLVVPPTTAVSINVINFALSQTYGRYKAWSYKQEQEKKAAEALAKAEERKAQEAAAKSEAEKAELAKKDAEAKALAAKYEGQSNAQLLATAAGIRDQKEQAAIIGELTRRGADTSREGQMFIKLHGAVVDALAGWTPEAMEWAGRIIPGEGKTADEGDFVVLRAMHDAGSKYIIPESAKTMKTVTNYETQRRVEQYIDKFRKIFIDADVMATQAKRGEIELQCPGTTAKEMIACDLYSKRGN